MCKDVKVFKKMFFLISSILLCVLAVLFLTKDLYANIADDKLAEAKAKLSEGRYYRRLFRLEHDLDDILMIYRPEPDDYTEYYKLADMRLSEYTNDAVSAFEDALVLDQLSSSKKEVKKGLAESVNELLQAQTLVGNYYMRESFRIRYPYSDNPVITELPKPTGDVREEVKKIAAAKDEYNLGILTALEILRKYDDIYRTRAHVYPLPYECCPQFLQFEDINIQNGDPQPLLNDFWQLSNTLHQKSMASYSMAHRLFGLSHNDEHAKEEAIQEFKQCAHDTFLASAALAASQSPEDFQMNQGQRLKIQIVNAREMHKYINAGLTPLGDDGKFISNNTFEHYLQQARDAIEDLKNAEVEAHKDSMEYNNAEEKMITEIISERQNFLDLMTSKYGVDHRNYGSLHTDADQQAYLEEVKRRMDAILDNPTDDIASQAGELGLTILKVIDSIINIERAQLNIEQIPELIKIIEWETGEIAKVYKENAAEIKALDLAMGLARMHSGMTPSVSVGFTTV